MYSERDMTCLFKKKSIQQAPCDTARFKQILCKAIPNQPPKPAPSTGKYQSNNTQLFGFWIFFLKRSEEIAQVYVSV